MKKSKGLRRPPPSKKAAQRRAFVSGAPERRKRVLDALARLKGEYDEVRCALDFKSPFELLVATILSAQCTDVRVNMVTPQVFATFPNANKLARARQPDVEKLIYSTGFYRNKAKNLIALGKALSTNFGGEVPRELAALENLPGVGRKTANVVLGNAYGIASGIAVDTHVIRLMNRLGVVETGNPAKIEEQLKQFVPQSEWIQFTHYFITHGRKVCIARTPHCAECALSPVCPSSLEVQGAQRTSRSHV